MTSFLNSALRSASTSLFGSGATTPQTQEPQPTNPTPLPSLFPKVDPTTDGPDCLSDCSTCTIKYPRGFKIDEEDTLYGHVSGWETHVLVATGKTDWVRDVEDEEGSVMEGFRESERKVESGRLMLSASNIPTPGHAEAYEGPTSVLLLPAFVIVEGVRKGNVASLIERFIDVGATNTGQFGGGGRGIPRALEDPLPNASELTSRPCTHSALILLCSQKTRDARCGQSAPLLRKELERHLRVLGLFRDLDDERPGGVGIYFISHVGGHKYSANVMIYRKRNAFGRDEGVEGVEDGEGKDIQEANQCIWLARIKPEDCEGLVNFTVLKGKVIKPESQLRGGFDRSRGVFSW